jgi:hypothetical protein
MSLLISSSSLTLWQDMIKHAENRCDIALKHDLEAYLTSLLIQYANKPDIVKQLFATAFLEAMQLRQAQRTLQLQMVGDRCLLFAGLFPQSVMKKNVHVRYFVDLGRSAYSAISSETNDLYDSLALEFVTMMDVLQSINHYACLLPLEAYDQWHELGSKRALKILQGYMQSKR